MGVSLLIGLQLARELGIVGYGMYGLAMSIIALLTDPTEFGLPQLLTSEVAPAQVANDWGKLRGILKWTNKMVVKTSAIIAIAVVVGILITKKNHESPLTITVIFGCIMVPFVALTNLPGATLQELLHIVKGQLPDTLIRPVAFSLLLFLVPQMNAALTPPIAMGLGVISTTMALGISIILLRLNLPPEVQSTTAQSQSPKWWSSALQWPLRKACVSHKGI